MSARVSPEVIAVLLRIGEDIASLTRADEAGPTAGSAGYGPPQG